MKLYVCGNGFDLHHKLKTSYADYKMYLEAVNPGVKKAYESFPGLIDGNEPWADIESALNIDYEELFYESVQSYYPDLNDDSDFRWDELWVNLDVMTRFVNDFTGDCFYGWLAKLDYSVAYADLPLEPDALFVTFNYTNTLERLYGIADNQVLHIHGALASVKVENCIGDSVIPSFHSIEEAEIKKPLAERDKWNCDCIREEIQFGATEISGDMVHTDIERIYGSDDFYGASIEPALRILESFVDKTTKNVRRNIPALQAFVADKAIDEVIIMGPSLGDADMPYYLDVLIPAFKHLKWVFMRHGGEKSKDADCIQHFIQIARLVKPPIIIDW